MATTAPTAETTPADFAQQGTIQTPNGPRPLRVALFTEVFLPKFDGVVRVTCLLMEHLRRVGADVMLFAPGEHPDEYAGYPVHSTPGVGLWLYPGLILGIPGKAVYEDLAQFRPDIIHISHPAMYGVRAIRFARRLGVPVIVSFQAHVMQMAQFYGWGFFEQPLWLYHKLIFRQADHIVAPSLQIASELEAHGFGEIGWWRRGVESDRFSPDYAKPELRDVLTDGHPERVLLLSIGRLAPEKQVEHIVPVLDVLPNTHLAIVGDGPHRASLEAAFAGRNVTFVGHKSGDELSAIYASGDIFLFPSSPIETFGLVAAEAMASGQPVIASRVGGVPEIVEHGVSGFIFESGDTDALVDYTRRLVEDADLREAMRHNALQAARTWSWEAAFDDFFATYHRVIEDYKSQQS